MRKITAALTVLLLGGACAPALAETQLNYWMWDNNQVPPYQACADEFHKQHPDISIKISQFSWNDYWTALSTGFVSGEAPDVFTNQLSRYPEFVNNNQVTDISDLIKRDHVPTDIYYKGLLDLWSKDGHIYGLPKDWDTVAMVYNKEMLAKAGVSEEELNNATWNPKDGGSFEKILAKLSVDANGNNGLSPNFDPKNVKQYGFVTPELDGYGQTQWSHFAVSNGFKFVDGLWATSYHYDDPKLAETLTWQRDLGLKKGFAIPQKDVGNNASGLFVAGKAAITPDGSWKISFYGNNAKFKVGYALLPTGPQGRRTMFNGLADGIWTGTKHLEESWQWVKFLASPACEKIVGASGVVFPAIAEAAKLSQDTSFKKGWDVSAFLKEATPEQTFYFPITDHSSEINSTMKAALEQIFLNDVDAAPVLKDANDHVNSVF
ncbi:ABC transporter substrate-binding protein [Labrys okinawensis]|uniref:ABC transporter substrate-binding protein n=1 Tax=Labrys okinawensis TaxID=346911 RepID=UPI0039BD6BFC